MSDDLDDLVFVDKAFNGDGMWCAIPLEEAKFSRYIVENWLAGRRFTSGYDFDPQDSGLLSPLWWAARSLEKPELRMPLPVNAAAENPEKPLSNREQDTLLKLVIGMAVKGYSHNPAAAKSSAPKDIADDLASLGISVSDDTVRKYLKEAAEFVLPVKRV